MPFDKYVVDTCALISYFENVFNKGTSISRPSLKIIQDAFEFQNIKLIFPSTVFIEVFKTSFSSEEQAEKIKIEVYHRIKSQENMEIQPFDREILENFIKITDIERDYKFDNHDKQIFAAAMAMNCPLITSDTRLLRYNNRKNFIPLICN